MLSFNENEFEKNENPEINAEDTNGETVKADDNAASQADIPAEDGAEALTERQAKKQAKKAKRLYNRRSFINSFKTRSTKAGTYTFAVCAIALAAVIVVNMIAGKLPASVKRIDTTKSDIYSLSDYSKQIVKNINEKVTVYLVATKGNEDKTLSTLLDRYAGLNDNIKVEFRDPELSRIAEQYGDKDLSDNSLIFVSDKRSKTVDYSSLYEYSEEAQQNYYYYGEQVQADIFDGENEITSALSYVTTDILPKVYSLTGHGETKLNDSVLTYVGNENIEVLDLDLMKAREVPDDCECLIVTDPTKDFSGDEKEAILKYLSGGGNMLVMTNAKETNAPNFAAVLENYGVQKQKGIIIEEDQNAYYLYFNYLMPNIQNHEITGPITEAGYRVLMPMSHGIEETASHRGTLEITSLVTTSKDSYSKVNPTEENYQKAEGDPEGPFNVGCAISETHGEVETRIVWFSTTYFLDDSLLAYTGNLNLFLNSLKWMCKLEKNISVIESKSLGGTDKLEITSGEGMLWNILFVGVLPVASVITGLAIWIRRKKR